MATAIFCRILKFLYMSNCRDRACRPFAKQLYACYNIQVCGARTANRKEAIAIREALNRSVRYLRVSVTDRCNLRCQYCMPADGISKKTHADMLRLEDFLRVIRVSARLGVDKLRFTGGEPLLRINLPWLIEQSASIPGIRDIGLTTNGVLLAPSAQTLQSAGLKRVNVSLDTLRPERYAKIARIGRLQDALDGIAAARQAGLTPIKINAVLIGGVNDDEIEDLAALSTNGFADEVRFIELMPIGQAAEWSAERFVSNDTVRERLGLTPLPSVDPASATVRYALPGGGIVGLINPMSHRFCGACNRLRLTADGKLKPCLLSDDEIDLKQALSLPDDDAMFEQLESIIQHKNRGFYRRNDAVQPIERNMFRIGG